MTKHSTDAFLDLLVTGKLNTRRLQLYDHMCKLDGFTLHELQAGLKWPMSTLSGRLSELLDLGVVYEMNTRFYVTLSREDAKWYHDQRLQERKQRWYNEGKKFGWH